MKKLILINFFACMTIMLSAQGNLIFESTQPNAPMDDVVERKLNEQKRVLPYAPQREGDIFWEKRIWRIIDTREKMNLPFRYPEKPLVSILIDGIKSGEITAYSPIDDKFSTQLNSEELSLQIYRRDTFRVVDPVTLEETLTVAEDDFNPDNVKRFRLKEIWYFDTNTSTLKVRILGIAPLVEEYDRFGNFRHEKPLFWVHYPSSREILARHIVFNPWNDKSVMSWEDLLEMRFFSSYITKESNVHDRRLEDYLSGVDLLLESEKIRMEIFNFEHDLWSY
jgi:gliding motility associated protien GldN